MNQGVEHEGWTTSENWPERAAELKTEGWCFLDLCGVDRLGLGGPKRFEIVCQFIHYKKKERRALHVLAGGDPPTVPSITPLWPAASFYEREAYDMFGIEFEGHPNLTRILMPDEWEGWPLRRDYGVGKVTIEFTPQPFLQIDTPGQGPDQGSAQEEVDALGQAGPAILHGNVHDPSAPAERSPAVGSSRRQDGAEQSPAVGSSRRQDGAEQSPAVGSSRRSDEEKE
jgi:NADH-quinone oxidoreductase subunit C